jgi:hypothetical protein
LFIIFAQNNNSAIPIIATVKFPIDSLIRAENDENLVRKKMIRKEKYAKPCSAVERANELIITGLIPA